MPLRIEKFRLKDIGRICFWIRTEAQMVQWSGPVFEWPLTQKQFLEHLHAVKTRPPTLFLFGLYRGRTLIGYCELSHYNRKSQSANLSRVIISPKHRKKGFAQIMISGVLKFGFGELGLNRIGLGVFDFNRQAIKCYKNMGFKPEGKLRETAKVGDSFWSCNMMSILRKEWTDNHTD